MPADVLPMSTTSYMTPSSKSREPMSLPQREQVLYMMQMCANLVCTCQRGYLKVPQYIHQPVDFGSQKFSSVSFSIMSLHTHASIASVTIFDFSYTCLLISCSNTNLRKRIPHTMHATEISMCVCVCTCVPSLTFRPSLHSELQ